MLENHDELVCSEHAEILNGLLKLCFFKIIYAALPSGV